MSLELPRVPLVSGETLAMVMAIMFCKTIRIIPAISAVLAAAFLVGCAMPSVKVTFGSISRHKEERGSTPPPSATAESPQTAPTTTAVAPTSIPDQPATPAPEPSPASKPAPLSLPAPKPQAVVVTESAPAPTPVPAPAPAPEPKPAPPAPPAPVETAAPKVNFEFGKKLSAGHKLELAVYTGLRSPKRLFEGDVTLDNGGDATFAKNGSVKLAGMTANQAIRAITSMFQSQGADRILSIQLKSIEDMPVVTVHGAVKQEGVIRWFDSATAASVLPYVGNRTGSGQAVYITREGRRVFHPSLEAATASGVLQPGDIITYTSDL